MSLHRKGFRHALLGASALAGAAALAMASPAFGQAREVQFDLEPQPLGSALRQYGYAADQTIIFADADVRSLSAPALKGSYTPDEGLGILLAGTDLIVERTESGIVRVRVAQDPQGGSAATGGATVEALIVTAQKREEDIQDVPIAISAFTQKELEAQKIEGGFDLLKAIPNVTFSKSNFSSYNFSIRGVGTKAISATTDPGVAVAFNNTTLIQNRLFEQEYFDVERVEVLRGPQGTLYGRNATSGVINVISAKPDLNDFEGNVKFEMGNYDARRAVAMVNVPIMEDVLAIRLAGSMTKRTGYDYNEITGNNINGRDLWSTRVTVGFEPTPGIRTTLLWEHFEENDDRSRTSKQLCHRDDGPDMIGNTDPRVVDLTAAGIVGQEPYYSNRQKILQPALFSQACKAGSLYDDAAFGTPNGVALPFVYAPLFTGADTGGSSLFPIGKNANGRMEGIIKLADPYGGLMQSRDLRTIASVRDPVYRAKADVFDLSMDLDIGDSLTLTSQTVYNKDEVFSFQDYNRFNSFPVFTDTSLLTLPTVLIGQCTPPFPPDEFKCADYGALSPGGVFNDPQIGPSDRIAGMDISQAKGEQFSQEIRLQSDFDGPLNFSFGANYTEFETVIDYYVFYNLITALALTMPFNRPIDGVFDLDRCAHSGYFISDSFLGAPSQGIVPAGSPFANCPYVDPNPVNFNEHFDGDGHNYFRSKNPYELESKAAFGELYWNINEALKLTAGLRYTDDTKSFTPVPSQVLLAPGPIAGGTVSRGYPEKEPIVQNWGEWTGRLGLDWKPELGFTDDTLLYAFYSRGYKGGGANPPSPGFATLEELQAYMEGLPDSIPDPGPFQQNAYFSRPVLQLNNVEYGPTFEPEFVDAYEVGAKNTLLGGAMTFNATGFYYDYKDYQVSQIRDRTAVNENFDAKVWGLEFETTFAPSRDFRLIANLGYLDTKIADGETSIDIMNRTQGNSDYVVIKPWAQLPSNCVIPTAVAEAWLNTVGTPAYWGLCGGIGGFLGFVSNLNPILDPQTGQRYSALATDIDGNLLYPEINGGAGILDELGGNELPNAPHWTTNVGGEYGKDILDGSWRVTLRGDAYWQSQSWARVYNAVNDKLHGWYNLNVSVRLSNEDWGVDAEFYVKNLLDKSPITDAFLNSDDTGLTTNVFVLDPRLVGFSVRKTF